MCLGSAPQWGGGHGSLPCSWESAGAPPSGPPIPRPAGVRGAREAGSDEAGRRKLHAHTSERTSVQTQGASSRRPGSLVGRIRGWSAGAWWPTAMCQPAACPGHACSPLGSSSRFTFEGKPRLGEVALVSPTSARAGFLPGNRMQVSPGPACAAVSSLSQAPPDFTGRRGPRWPQALRAAKACSTRLDRSPCPGTADPTPTVFSAHEPPARAGGPPLPGGRVLPQTPAVGLGHRGRWGPPDHGAEQSGAERRPRPGRGPEPRPEGGRPRPGALAAET